MNANFSLLTKVYSYYEFIEGCFRILIMLLKPLKFLILHDG